MLGTASTRKNAQPLLVSRAADYTNVVFRAEIAANPGTEAFVGVRLQQQGDTWVGMALRIYDDGGNILAGKQWSNFGHREPGLKRLPFNYGDFFRIRMRMVGNENWIAVNGTATSVVKYNGPRSHTNKGSVGIHIMDIANIHNTKAKLSELIKRALAGEEVVIAKAGEPMVRLTPVQQDLTPRKGAVMTTPGMRRPWSGMPSSGGTNA